MVLWELTLVTAYVLGLKRTYRLALRYQRKLLKKRFPRALEFTERRTKSVFAIALSVHKEIQRKDISVGRNLSNRLLRMLDRLRPQANIRGVSTTNPGSQCAPVKPSGTKVDNKSSQSKQDQFPRKDNIVGGNFSTYVNHMRVPSESTFRSRITDGLKLKRLPTMRPFPALSSFGGRWHPARWQSGIVGSSPTDNWASRAQSIHVLHAGFIQRQRSVFRDDIIRLMDIQRS